MKESWIVKKISLLLVCILTVGSLCVLPAHAGASDIVVDSSSFKEKLDTSIWNNPDGDITVQEGVLMFPKESTDSTALITKTRAKISKDHDEVVSAEVTMKLTQLPEGETFVIALGLKSVEAIMEEEGNVEIRFSNNGGLNVGVVAYDDAGDETVIAESVACGSIGSVLKIKAEISSVGVLTLTVNNKQICASQLPVNGEGCVGFLQTGSCGAEVSNVNIVSHRYDRPENPDVYEDFENETINVNTLTSKLIHSGYGALPSKTYIDEIDGNRVFRFENTSTTYLGTIYQYSNFEMTFDVLDLQREKVEDESGNMLAARTDNFAISFGGDAADFIAYGYDNATDLLIFQGSSIFSWHTDKNVDVAAQGYAFSDPKCNKDFTVRLSVIDSMITVSIKWIDETEFKEVMQYQISKETPNGNIHIWTTGKSSTFAIDNLSIVNKDVNPNLIEVGYESGLIDVPEDFQYQPLEYIYKEVDETMDITPYLMVAVVAGVCVIGLFIAVILKQRKIRKGGDTDEKTKME